MSLDLARTDDAQRGLAVADREQAAGRNPFPVTLICRSCDQPFVAVLWYRSQPKAYCSDLCRSLARDAQRVSLADRIWPKVDKDGPVPELRADLGPCWLWTGSKTKGYGYIQSGGSSDAGHHLPILAHRAVYELVVGPIPDGLTLDHLCFRTSCVNPSHMEPVTNRENILRSGGPSAHHARATHCQRGHEKTEPNTYRYPGGWTECRICRTERNQRSRS